jgi:8-oxo-dGTP pyrophosphatase MutT (NUDIX family)
MSDRENAKHMFNENFWEEILHALPLYIQDKNDCIAIRKDELSNKLKTKTGIDIEVAKLLVDLLESILDKLGVLDENSLSRGEWKFISYSARLLTCSFVSTLAGRGRLFFEARFWREGGRACSELLKRLEEARDDPAETSPPIRQNIVSWAALRRGDLALLYTREIKSDDPDNLKSGRYTLPGGRMETQDIGRLLDVRNAALFLYGIPGDFVIDNRELAPAYIKTLQREIEEELGLRSPEDYTIDNHRDLDPYEGIYGDSEQRVKAVTKARLFYIRLTTTGLLKLATTSEKDQNKKWVNRGDLENESARGKAFLSAFKGEYDALFDAPDIEECVVPEELKNYSVIIPADERESLELVAPNGQRKKFVIPDSECVNLLLYLAIKARGFPCEDEQSWHVGWGWLELNGRFLEISRRLSDIMSGQGCPNLLCFCQGKCRLAQTPRNIFLSPSLFTAYLDTDRLELTRERRNLLGLCKWKDEAKTIVLRETNTDTLSFIPSHDEKTRLEGSNEDPSSLYDENTFRKIKDNSTKQLLIEAVRDFGLRSLFEKRNEAGEWVFAVRCCKSEARSPYKG